MKIRKYKNDPEELLRIGKEIMTTSKDSKYIFKVFCVNLVLGGVTAKQVAQLGGVSPVSVSNWVRSVDEHGFESLRNKKSPGRPKKLSENIIAEIDNVLQKDPNKYGFKVWDGPSLSSYIYDKYGIKYSVRQCQRLFHKLGYSKIRPRTFPSKGNENSDARQAFKKKLKGYESNDNYTIVYEDEVHFQIQTTITSGWYKKGSKPSVKSFPSREKLSYLGFVTPETGELFVTKPDKFNYITTISSIRDFLSVSQTSIDKRVVIIMDNAPWHKKAYRLIYTENLPEYEDIRFKAEILMLPPYSPDLNPIERVWRVTRRENTHNVFFKSIQLLEKKVDEAFESWKHPNRKLATLCGC